VSGYAEGAVKWAVANGILKGRNLNELAPQGTATRAEVAVMLERFVNLYTADKQA
ncbi:MAG: S-layer homology domain-containing protein, partial [Peptococcaceae bacterium]|nr:S-layer homology domain-containing protein [Peptococcaceae bacterium]